MKQTPEAIYMITATPALAEVIKQPLVLRGFDEIVCLPLDSDQALLQTNPPALVIIDAGSETESLLKWMRAIPASVNSLVLAPAFNEEVFVACHDAGARDFLVKPIPDAYLVSRIIQALSEHRKTQIDAQKDRILVEAGVLSANSGLFTTSHLLKRLKQECEQLLPDAPAPLSLLLVELQGYQSPLPEAYQNALMKQVGQILKESARGMDIVGECFMDKCAVILPDTGKRGATALGKRILQRLQGLPFQGPNGELQLQVHMGVGEYTGCRHYEDLINQAMAHLKGEPSPAGQNRQNPLHPV